MQIRPAQALQPLTARLPSPLRHLHFRPIDTSTTDGRSAQRLRLAAWATATNVVSRTLSMVLVVMSVRLALPYLGAERFGVWAAFASCAAMLSFLDLGVGNALLNRVAHASTLDSPQELRRAVTGGAGILLVFATAGALLLGVVAAGVPWQRLFRLNDPMHVVEASRTAFIFAALFGVYIFSSGLLRVLLGQQRAYEAHLISACGNAVACVATAVAAHEQAGVPWLLATSFGIQTIGCLAIVPLLHMRGLLRMRGMVTAVRQEWPYLVRTGALFLILQIATMIGWGSDAILLASLFGAGHVAVYAVAQRLFQFASQPLAMLNMPMWAAYADAHARGDHAFIARMLRLGLGMSIAAGVVLSLALTLSAPRLIPLWTDEVIDVPTALLVAFAVWTVLEIGGSAFAMYLNGCGIVRQQTWVMLAFCIVALPLKIALAHAFGVAGFVAGTACAYATVVVALYTTVFRDSVLQPLRPHA